MTEQSKNEAYPHDYPGSYDALRRGRLGGRLAAIPVSLLVPDDMCIDPARMISLLTGEPATPEQSSGEVLARFEPLPPVPSNGEQTD